LRFGISTRVFFGFVIVIVAFALASLYNIHRTAQLRENITYLREGVLPVEKELVRVEETLRSYHRDVLGQSRRRSASLERLADQIPRVNAHVFERFSQVEEGIRKMVTNLTLSPNDRDALQLLAERVSRLQDGSLLVRRIGSKTSKPTSRSPAISPLMERTLGSLEERASNRVVFTAVTEAFIKAVEGDQLDAATQVLGDLRRMVAEMLRNTRMLRREVSRQVTAANDRAKADERRAMGGILLASASALLVSLIVLMLTLQRIRRINILIEGVRSVSRGDYGEPLEVGGNDEIRMLADEFNQMERSLQERDQMLATQRAELMAAERLATIGRMSAQITHEIRNPLSSIGLNAELLQDEIAQIGMKDTSEAVVLIKAIGGEVDRLNAVTEHYLRFARLPRPEPVLGDLCALVQSLVDFVRPDLRHKGVVIRATVGTLPDVPFDANLMRQALINLIRNAAEAIQEGGEVDLVVDLEEEWARIHVQDNGSGISGDHIEQIFEPFFSTRAEGTGLGLALAREIVEEHGGRVDVSTEVGVGTTFVVRLPLTTPHPGDQLEEV
jgi:signal transduction histidine kinase